MTKYEKKIYDIVSVSGSHMTAEQVFSELKLAYPRVSRATVYNNLNKLCDVGLIRRLSTDGFADRFDNSIRHDHLLCQCCKKLTDISIEDLTGQIKKQLDIDFVSYELKVIYICPECKKTGESALNQ